MKTETPPGNAGHLKSLSKPELLLNSLKNKPTDLTVKSLHVHSRIPEISRHDFTQ